MTDDAKREAHLRAMERHYRQKGYDDGYAGRKSASANTAYQRAWRRGVQARAEEEAKT